MRRPGVCAVAVVATVVCASAWAPYGAAAPLAAEPVDLGGQELPAGSRTDAGNPIELTAGLWADTLGTGLEGTHYFSYRRTMEDSTVHIGVVGTSDEPYGDGFDLGATVGQTDCYSTDESQAVQGAAFGAVLTVGSSEPGASDGECLDAEQLTITVERNASSAEHELPIAIKVVEEAPARLEAGGTDLPAPAEEVRYQVPDAGSAEDLAGGTAFDDAPLLDPVADGVTIDAEIDEGEERLYRLPVGWEQQVVAAARVPAIEDEGFSYGPTVDLRIIEPSRNTLTTYAVDEYPSGTYGSEPLTLSVGAMPLRYRNRFESVTPTLPGDYWVAVAVSPLDPNADREPVTVPIELTVAVTGESGEGAPTYPENVPSYGGGATPEGYSPETPYLVGEGRFAAVASGNPVDPDDDEAWWGARRAAGLGLGAVSLACCAVGVVWLVRRRVR